jgi:uncharacterized protein
MTDNIIIRKRIRIEETDLILKTDRSGENIPNFIIKQRLELKNYIRVNPDFLTSFEPIMVGVASTTLGVRKSILQEPPLIVKLMARAGRKGNVGPMAAVAGSISQLCMGFLISKGAKYVIVDNGGDISLKTNKDVIIGLYAGESSLSGHLGFKIQHRKTPMGICTSSGTVGHSISFGRSDSVTVFAKEASIADALATSIANSALGVNDHDAVQSSLEKAEDFRKIMDGVLVVVGEHAGTIGRIPKLVKTDKKVVLSDLFET